MMLFSLLDEVLRGPLSVTSRFYEKRTSAQVARVQLRQEFDELMRPLMDVPDNYLLVDFIPCTWDGVSLDTVRIFVDARRRTKLLERWEKP
jgi:hypothetical protein